jgi:glycosyltransferase involved in cell wall biosynthesis
MNKAGGELQQDSQQRTTPEISVIIPAYNEQAVIASVVDQVHRVLGPLGRPYETIVVDDGSDDCTAFRARASGARIIAHPYNIGNGAAVKTGIRSARGRILVMLDGDGQHPPDAIPRLLEKLGPYDMVVGARMSSSATDLHRDVANRAFSGLATYVSGQRIEDLTSGFRAIKTDVARQFVSLLPNSFSYPSTITLAAIRSGYSLAYVPVRTTRRIGKSKIQPLRDGYRFLLIILKITTLYSPLKLFMPISILMFLVGLGYGLYKIFVLGARYGPTSAMLMSTAVVVFLVGLVSEQIAQLRFERSEVAGNHQSLGSSEASDNHQIAAAPDPRHNTE